MKKINPAYLIILLFITSYLLPCQLKAQVCAGNFTLTTQADVDAFNCTSVTGSIFIFGTAINNLNGLSNLTSIGGDLYLSSNIFLTSLDGLSKLTSIGGVLTIVNHANLMNINGLSNLDFVGGNFFILSNGSLENLDSLSNLVSVGGNFYIQNNASLTNVDGLYNLNYVGGNLEIRNNNSLTMFCGLCQLFKTGELTGDYFVENNMANPTQNDILMNCSCPEDIAIPTLSQWGIIALSMIMLILGLVGLKQRKVIFG